MGLGLTKHVDQDDLGPHAGLVLSVVLENKGASTVGKCSKNSRGEKVRSTKNLKEWGQAEWVGNWEAHWGWRENNWIIYSRQTQQVFIHGSYIARDTESKRDKEMNTKMQLKTLKQVEIGVAVENGVDRSQLRCCARFVHTCTQMCQNLHWRRSWNATTKSWMDRHLLHVWYDHQQATAADYKG